MKKNSLSEKAKSLFNLNKKIDKTKREHENYSWNRLIHNIFSLSCKGINNLILIQCGEEEFIIKKLKENGFSVKIKKEFCDYLNKKQIERIIVSW